MLDNIIKILYSFQQKHPNIYIGGSTALILQEAIPYRVPKDIDIISPQKTIMSAILNTKHYKIGRYEGLRFELFNNPKAQYIEFNYKENILKLSPIDEIYEWKYKFIHEDKHLKDIKERKL